MLRRYFGFRLSSLQCTLVRCQESQCELLRTIETPVPNNNIAFRFCVCRQPSLIEWLCGSQNGDEGSERRDTNADEVAIQRIILRMMEDGRLQQFGMLSPEQCAEYRKEYIAKTLRTKVRAPSL